MDNAQNEPTAAYNPSHGLVGGGYAGKSATLASQTSDRPPSEIESAINDNAAVTNRVAELVAVLHDRLGTVMRSPVPTDEKSDAERGYSTHRATQIAASTRNLGAVADILGSMLDRLEV